MAKKKKKQQQQQQQRAVQKSRDKQKELKKRLSKLRGRLAKTEDKLTRAQDRAERWKREAKKQRKSAAASRARAAEADRPSATTPTASEGAAVPDETWTVAQLRTEARDRGLAGMSNRPKAELLAALSQSSAPAAGSSS